MCSITQIEEKLAKSIRIDCKEALFLYTNASLALLGKWADRINHRKNKELVFYNKTTKRSNQLGVRKTFRDFIDIIIKNKNL